jgi:putative ABC transport system ATP-binding protein
MNALLKSTNLNKSYRIDANDEQQVLFDINVRVHPGEFISIMGPSGSGKSTLLYSLCGMDPLSSGSVQFKDHALEQLSEPRLARMRLNEMGFVFQQIHLLQNLSIMDNVLLPGYLSKRNPRRLVEDRARELLERTGISSLADRSITQASGGQLQRVGICRALINQPDIIFGDEPTGALNSKASAEIMELLTEVNQTGTTILLVTHDLRIAARTHRVLLMKDGRMISEKALGPIVDGSGEVTRREATLASWLQEHEV